MLRPAAAKVKFMPPGVATIGTVTRAETDVARADAFKFFATYWPSGTASPEIKFENEGCFRGGWRAFDRLEFFS
jgi:hypothetical protein